MGNRKIFHLWVNSSLRNFHVSLGVISVASYFVGNLSGNIKMHILAEIVALFTIFHYFLHGYFHRQQRFLSNNEKIYTLPKKKIAKIGSKFLATFLIFVAVGMSVVKELYEGTLLAKLKAMWMFLMGQIFGALIETDGLGSDELVVKDGKELIDAMDQIAAKQESPWENMINNIQTILVFVGVVFLIVLVISMLVNYARHLISSAKVNGQDQSGRDITDKEESLRGKSAKREKLLDFSPSAKARRIYRKYIQRQKRKGQVVPEWMTPAEIEAMVAMPEEVKYRELHSIYEKARYSENGCTDEEANRAKMLKV